MVYSDRPNYPLSTYGLSSSPDAERVRDVFPRFANDPMQSQAALAFLLLKNRVAVTVTIASGYPTDADRSASSSGDEQRNLPLGFDFSHQAHRAAQAIEWDRLLRTADGLITLLKAEELGNGVSYWDRSMIYIATDFGRSKNRPANAADWSSSHDLNNGVVAISPLVKGNRILGGVDPETGLTYGFDPRTGAPEPGRTMQEREIYAGLLQALGVDTSKSGLPDVPAIRG